MINRFCKLNINILNGLALIISRNNLLLDLAKNSEKTKGFTESILNDVKYYRSDQSSNTAVDAENIKYWKKTDIEACYNPTGRHKCLNCSFCKHSQHLSKYVEKLLWN